MTLDEARRVVRELEATRRKQMAAQKKRRSLELQARQLLKKASEAGAEPAIEGGDGSNA